MRRVVISPSSSLVGAVALAFALVLGACGGASASTMSCDAFLGLDQPAQAAEVASSSLDLELNAEEAEQMGLRDQTVQACSATGSDTVGDVVADIVNRLAD